MEYFAVHNECTIGGEIVHEVYVPDTDVIGCGTTLRDAIEEARVKLTFKIEDSRTLPTPLTRQEVEAVGRKEAPELVPGCDIGPARFRDVVVLAQLPGGGPSKTDAELEELTREVNRGYAPRVRGTPLC